MPVDAGAADVDDAPDIPPVGFFEQRLGRVDVDGTELPIIDSADVWRVQGSSVDQELGLPECGTAHFGVSEVPGKAGPSASYSVDATNEPTIRMKCCRNRRAYAARGSRDRRGTDRWLLASPFVHRSF